MSIDRTVRILDRTTPPHVITLVLLAGVSALNLSIFLPSLNGMTVYFETDYSVMQIAVSGYFLMTAILTLFIGPLSDRYGRRPVILWSLGAFVVATLGAIFAPNVWVFLVFRMIQASVASCMSLSRAVVRDIYPTDQAASQIGYITMGMSLIPMVGPMIGGTLDELFNWQASFAFLVVAGSLLWLLTYFDLGETATSKGDSFRDQAKNYPELLRSVRFWGYVACSAFTAGGFYAFLGGASFVAGTIFGLSPSMTGLALGAPAIGYMLGNFLSGRYSVTYGINRLIFWGCAITLVGPLSSGLFLLAGISHASLYFGLLTIMGLGNGLTMPNATAGSLSVRPQLAGTASGLGAAIMMAAGAGISGLAGNFLDPRYGALALSMLMSLCAVLALASIVMVMRRERRLGLQLVN